MKRYSVIWGRIGGDIVSTDFDTRREAQALGEALQRIFFDAAQGPSTFCQLSRHCPRWNSELPDGRFVSAQDNTR
jgi:hypothetical protein